MCLEWYVKGCVHITARLEHRDRISLNATQVFPLTYHISYGTMSCVSWSAVWIVPLIMYSTSPPSVYIHDGFYLDFYHMSTTEELQW